MLHVWNRSQELEQSESVSHGMKPSCFDCFLSVFTISMESTVVSSVTEFAESPVGSLGLLSEKMWFVLKYPCHWAFCHPFIQGFTLL